METKQKNVLIDVIHEKYIPFEQIKNEMYYEAFEHSIQLATNEIEKIIKSNTPLSLSHFEKASDLFDQLKIIYNNLIRINSLNQENLQTEKINTLISNFESSIYSNKKLYEKFKESKGLFKEKEDLSAYNYHMRKFIENGMEQNEEKLKQLKDIKVNLTNLISQYELNMIKETNEYFMIIDNEDDLKEFPESIKKIAKEEALKKNIDKGYCFTLDYPSYNAVMTYCSNEAIRKELYLKYNSKCYNTSHSNVDLVKKIVELRKKKALLLGYNSYNEYVLSNRMAKNEKNVFDFQQKIYSKVIPKAKDEYEEIKKFASVSELNPWDLSYYSEKYKKHLFGIDSETLRSYFPLTKVFNILFELINQLFNLTFTEDKTVKLYHEDIIVFNIKKEENILGYLYFDLFPRKSKTMGGWVYPLKPKVINKIPIVGIVANIQRESSDSSNLALLSLREAETIFHETGHALHIILSEVKYKSLEGINVLWDFVEMPSQLMENFFYESKILAKFELSEELIEKVKKMKNYLIAMGTLRQLNYSNVDLMLHKSDFDLNNNLEEFEKTNVIEIFNRPKGICLLTAFSHLFNATYDYSCGYYSYMWAEVFALDGYEEFKKGDYKEVAERYRKCILSKGGTEDPEILFKNFKGKEYSIEPFLIDKGLI